VYANSALNIASSSAPNGEFRYFSAREHGYIRSTSSPLERCISQCINYFGNAYRQEPANPFLAHITTEPAQDPE